MALTPKLAWIGPPALAMAFSACAATQQNRPNEFYAGAPQQLLILNESEEVICYVKTRNSRGGMDRLDVDDVVAPGEERAFSIQGTQRLALLDCNRQTIFLRPDIQFDEEGKVLRFYARE
ncbi:MAG: hypothetical protein AB8H86_21975 [Polyangiales bacterium]